MVLKLSEREKKILITLRKGMTFTETTKGDGDYKGRATFFHLREKSIRKKVKGSSLYPSLNKLIEKGVVDKDSVRDGGSSYMVNIYSLTNKGKSESNKLLTINNKKLKSFSVKSKFKRHKLNFTNKNITVDKMSYGEKKSIYKFSWTHDGRKRSKSYKAKDFETAKKDFKGDTVDFEYSSFPR